MMAAGGKLTPTANAAGGVPAACDDAVMRLREIVFDCEHPAPLARFWAAVLDGFDVRPYDDEEVTRLAKLGFTPETDPCVMVDGPGIKLGFQRTDTGRPAKNRLHLDVASADRQAATELAVTLGATVVEVFEGNTWLRDPEGNDFCITDG